MANAPFDKKKRYIIELEWSEEEGDKAWCANGFSPDWPYIDGRVSAKCFTFGDTPFEALDEMVTSISLMEETFQEEKDLWQA